MVDGTTVTLSSHLLTLQRVEAQAQTALEMARFQQGVWRDNAVWALYAAVLTLAEERLRQLGVEPFTELQPDVWAAAATLGSAEGYLPRFEHQEIWEGVEKMVRDEFGG